MADATGIDWGSLGSALLGAGVTAYGANQSNKAINSGLQAQQQATANATSLQNPYLAAGMSAVPKLIAGDVGSMPGYEFTRSEGEKAINRNAAARQNFGTAGTIKDLLKFNQGNADTFYGNGWNRLVNMANIGQNSANATGGLMTGMGDATAAAGQQKAGVNNAALTAGVNALSGGGQSLINGAASTIADLYKKYFGDTGSSYSSDGSVSGSPYTGSGNTVGSLIDGGGFNGSGTDDYWSSYIPNPDQSNTYFNEWNM